MMNSVRHAALLGLWLLICVTSATAADDQRIRWVIQAGQEADKLQAERIYDAACAWVAEHFALSRTPIRPAITIHVGEACPDEELNRACYSPASSDLYLPTWEETSPAAVAHASLLASLLQLLNRDELRRTVASLISEDASNFVNARGVAPRGNAFRK